MDSGPESWLRPWKLMLSRQPLDRCGKFLEPIHPGMVVKTHLGGQLTFSEVFLFWWTFKTTIFLKSTTSSSTSTNQVFPPFTEGSSHLVRMLQGVSLPEECQNVDSDLSSLMPLISGDPSELMIPVMKPRGWCQKGKRATYLMVQGHRCIIHEYTYPYKIGQTNYTIYNFTYHKPYYMHIMQDFIFTVYI